MALSLNKPKLDNLASDIWKSAERLRGKFKAYEYLSVILPIIVIRRLECVLITWREAKRMEVRAKRPKLTEKQLAAGAVDDNVKRAEARCVSVEHPQNKRIRIRLEGNDRWERHLHGWVPRRPSAAENRQFVGIIYGIAQHHLVRLRTLEK